MAPNFMGLLKMIGLLPAMQKTIMKRVWHCSNAGVIQPIPSKYVKN